MASFVCPARAACPVVPPVTARSTSTPHALPIAGDLMCIPPTFWYAEQDIIRPLSRPDTSDSLRRRSGPLKHSADNCDRVFCALDLREAPPGFCQLHQREDMQFCSIKRFCAASAASQYLAIL